MLSDKLKHQEIILASKSPRRQELLKKLEIPFSIDVKEVDEVYPSDLKAYEITNFLSELKSNAFKDLESNEILLTSDTIVWFKNRALEKPRNYQEAFDMLKSLSGTNHSVFTSICIRTNNFRKTFYEETVVHFKPLDEKEIKFYLNHFKYRDKAGSYGIQDWMGYIAVTKIEGCYYNVMGLPVHKLYKELMKFPNLS